MTTFVCWLWPGRDFEPRQVKYRAQHVNVLGSMLRRHGGHRLVCVTPSWGGIDPTVSVIQMPADVAELPRFYPKLWAFSEAFGKQIGERFASIDLDCVILGDLGPLLDHEGDFVVWDYAKGELYNTSFLVLEPGARRQVWDGFSLHAAVRAQREWRYRWTGDQSWCGYVLGPGERTFSDADGLCVYRSGMHRDAPQEGAKAMFFCGAQLAPDTEIEHSAWLREAWQ